MLIKDIVNRVNRLLSNNSSFRLNYDTLKFYIDGSIDNINRELKTEYANPDTIYYSNLKYNFALCNNRVILYIQENDPEYNVTVDNGIVEVYDKYGNPYEGMADTVYLEEYDMLVYKSDNDFDTEITEDYIYSFPHTIENMNYSEIPDRYIRSCVCYYAAALYLEEEDEMEGQYQIYKSKADEELKEWRRQYYSCYDVRW